MILELTRITLHRLEPTCTATVTSVVHSQQLPASDTTLLSAETLSVDSFQHQHFGRATHGEETCERLQIHTSFCHDHSPQPFTSNNSGYSAQCNTTETSVFDRVQLSNTHIGIRRVGSHDDSAYSSRYPTKKSQRSQKLMDLITSTAALSMTHRQPWNDARYGQRFTTNGTKYGRIRQKSQKQKLALCWTTSIWTSTKVRST